MQAELQKELEDDKAVYEMLACWCSTNEKEKTQALRWGRLGRLSSRLFLGRPRRR